MAERVYIEPTEDQLVSFCAVMALGPGPTDGEKDTVRGILRIPRFREIWLRRHREMQEQAWALADRYPSQRSNDAPSAGANPALIRTQHTTERGQEDG